MKKPYLFVGIDPGTTIGYAMLDFSGKIVRQGYVRGSSLDFLVREINSSGRPVVVGTDKAKSPYFVSKLASSFGARVVCPIKDLTSVEKAKLVGANRTKNSHEWDALASALHSYQRLSPILKRADIVLQSLGKTAYAEEVKARALFNRDITIQGALACVIDEERKENHFGRANNAMEKSTSRRLQPLAAERLKSLEAENSYLKEYQLELSGEIKKLQSQMQLERMRSNRLAVHTRLNRLLKHRSRNIRVLLRELDQQKKNAANYREILCDLRGFVICKRLADLSYNEFIAKRKTLKIQTGDVLFVDNPMDFSIKALNELKGVVSHIIWKGEIDRELKKIKWVSLIDSKHLTFREFPDFCLVDRIEFEQFVKKSRLLVGLIEDYKKGRKENI